MMLAELHTSTWPNGRRISRAAISIFTAVRAWMWRRAMVVDLEDVNPSSCYCRNGKRGHWNIFNLSALVFNARTVDPCPTELPGIHDFGPYRQRKSREVWAPVSSGFCNVICSKRGKGGGWTGFLLLPSGLGSDPTRPTHLTNPKIL